MCSGDTSARRPASVAIIAPQGVVKVGLGAPDGFAFNRFAPAQPSTG
jgi:hypothetical protein